MFRVIIAGSRDFSDYQFLREKMDRLLSNVKEPIADVWMNRLIDDVYHGEFDTSKYAEFAGYVQQLQFYHYRQMAR